MIPVTPLEKQTSAVQSKKAAWLKQIRQLHLYLGTFFAPSIMFFALTGAFQLFGLHEGRPGESYQPPAWLAKLASIHKKQTLVERRGPSPGSADGERKRPPLAEANGEAKTRDQRRVENRRDNTFTIALKWFFLATSIGLVFTTLLGIYMAFKFNRSRSLVWSLLAGGTAVPAALIALMV